MRNLRQSHLRDHQEPADINPMDGLANMADLMLVLACGIMMALVMNWNVDLGGSENLVGLDQGQEVQELEGVSQDAGGLNNNAGYEELGKVYRDPATGKLYMVTTQSQ